MIVAGAVLGFFIQPTYAADAPNCVTRTIIHDNGSISFQNSTVRDKDELVRLYQGYFKQNPHCEMNIVTDSKNAPFLAVGEAIYALQKVGFPRVGFLMEPANLPPK